MLAVITLTAGYSAIVTASRAGIPTAVDPQLTEPTSPPRVEGLGPLLPSGRWTSAALTGTREQRRTGTAAVDVEGPQVGTGGLAVLDGDSQAVLAWVELGDRPLPARLELPGIPSGEHWLVAARSVASARFSYVCRVALVMENAGDRVRGAVSIDVTRHRLTLDLEWPELTTSAPPLVSVVLRRDGDPAWRYLPPTSQHEDPERPHDGHRLFDLPGLGAGTYQLSLDGATPVLDDAPELRVTLPRAEPLKIRCQNP